MAPGGEMFRFYSAFRRERTAYPGGMNASPTVKTQCVRKSSNTNLSLCLRQMNRVARRGRPRARRICLHYVNTARPFGRFFTKSFLIL